LKLDQAQYRELEAFSKFGSDLDAATMSVLEKGKRNVEILKQPQYSPVSVEKQVAIIYLGSKGALRNIAVDKVKDFEEDYLTQLSTRYPEILEAFKAGQLPEDALAKVEALVKEMEHSYK
jgi:F-type H+-transporting ATPase subunit alpha